MRLCKSVVMHLSPRLTEAYVPFDSAQLQCASETPPCLIMYSAIFFGGQLVKIDIAELQHTRRYVTSRSDLQVLHDALIDFEGYGERLELADPELRKVGTQKTASLFSSWIRSGDDASISDVVNRHSNAISSALTVLHQVLLVKKYPESYPCTQGQNFIQPDTVLEGLCIGKLSAAVIRVSWGDREMAKTLAKALRLAFCIGAYVDLDRHRLGSRAETICLVVMNYAAHALEQLHATLLAYDDVSNYTTNLKTALILRPGLRFSIPKVEVDHHSG